jgi:hypothetical protein
MSAIRDPQRASTDYETTVAGSSMVSDLAVRGQ